MLNLIKSITLLNPTKKINNSILLIKNTKLNYKQDILIIKYLDFTIIQQCFELFDIFNIIFNYITDEKTTFNFLIVKKDFYMLFKLKHLKNKITTTYVPQSFIYNFIEQNILNNQTDIVQYMIENEEISYEIDILEQYDKIKKDIKKKLKEKNNIDIDNEEEYPEIYNWFLLRDEYIYRKLKEENEIVIYHMNNYWWGRQVWGQSISLDLSIKNICFKLYHN